MKYSVWDFSQVKMAEYNASHPGLELDPTDVFIFSWFKGFSGRTKAKRNNKEIAEKSKMWTKEINGVDYYLVRYDAIIKDFPLLGYTDTKSIQRRFNKYVSGGIMDKQIIYNGRNGNYAYFAFTDLFWAFEYDSENPEHRKNEITTKETENKQNENKMQSKCEQKETLKIEKIYIGTETDENKHYQKNNEKDVSPDNSDQTKDVSPDNSDQTKGVSPDNSDQTKGVSLDNSDQTLINNPTTNLKNPTTTLNPQTNLISEKENDYKNNQNICEGDSVVVVFKKTINNLFGFMPTFTKDFLPELLKAFKTAGLDNNHISEYLEFIYPILQKKCKNPGNFTSYFYSSAKVIDNVMLYISETKKTEQLQRKQEIIICPVCGTKHKKADYACPGPGCNLYAESLENPEDIKYFKAIYNLKNNKKNEQLYQNYIKEKNKLDEKYPVTERLRNREISEKYCQENNEIDEKYFCKIQYLNVEKTA